MPNVPVELSVDDLQDDLDYFKQGASEEWMNIPSTSSVLQGPTKGAGGPEAAAAALDAAQAKRARSAKRQARPASKYVRVFFDNANDRLYIDGKW